MSSSIERTPFVFWLNARVDVPDPRRRRCTDAEAGPQQRLARAGGKAGLVPTPLHQQRIRAVLQSLRRSRAESVLDLGCGEGELLVKLIDESQITRIVALDSSTTILQRARQRLGNALTRERHRVRLVTGSITSHEHGLTGFDAAVLLETIEHIEPKALSKLERVVFGRLRPG